MCAANIGTCTINNYYIGMCTTKNNFFDILNSDQHIYDKITTSLWLLYFGTMFYAEMADGVWLIFFDFFFLIRLLAVSRSSAIFE